MTYSVLARRALEPRLWDLSQPQYQPSKEQVALYLWETHSKLDEILSTIRMMDQTRVRVREYAARALEAIAEGNPLEITYAWPSKQGTEHIVRQVIPTTLYLQSHITETSLKKGKRTQYRIAKPHLNLAGFQVGPVSSQSDRVKWAHIADDEFRTFDMRGIASMVQGIIADVPPESLTLMNETYAWWYPAPNEHIIAERDWHLLRLSTQYSQQA